MENQKKTVDYNAGFLLYHLRTFSLKHTLARDIETCTRRERTVASNLFLCPGSSRQTATFPYKEESKSFNIPLFTTSSQIWTTTLPLTMLDVMKFCISALCIAAVINLTDSQYVGSCGDASAIKYGSQTARPLAVVDHKVFFPHDMETANEYCEWVWPITISHVCK